jgi:DNA-binding protein HU-beta
MTKAEIVNSIAKNTGIDRVSVMTCVEGFMEEIMNSMIHGENVYFRGFGSFVIKKRAAKTARHIKNETTLMIPERYVPTFKPSQYFAENLRTSLDPTK